MPKETDPEAQTLGAALIDDGAAATVVALLTPEMFTGAKSVATFTAIATLISRSVRPDIVAVTNIDKSLGSYVADLVSSVGSTTNIEYYARIVHERYMAKQARRAATELQHRLDGDEDIFNTIDEIQKALSEITVGPSATTTLDRPIADARSIIDAWQRQEKPDTVPSGFYSLDRLITGFPKANLTTLAAHQGAGKTSLIVQMALAYGYRERKNENPKPALIISAEMTAANLVIRAASNASQTATKHARSGIADAGTYDELRRGLASLANLPVHISDNSKPSLPQIQAIIRRLTIYEGGVGIVFVDYDEKIRVDAPSEELRVSRIAVGLNDIAKEFNIPVVMLSQYSRASKTPSWPDDSWLRYSSMKEAESALIIHWYWPQYWVRKGFAPKDIPEYEDAETGYLVVTKNRFGHPDHVRMIFVPDDTRFVDRGDPEWDEPTDKKPEYIQEPLPF